MSKKQKIKLVYPMTFCTVTTDKFVENGLNKGSIVFIAGMRAIPEDESDPYTQRIKCFAHKVAKDGHTLVEEGFFIIDPKNLSPLSEKKSKPLAAMLERDYGEENPTTH